MRQLPYDINDKMNEKLQTIGNNANPQMEISIARAKNTITDADPWTVETIRQKEGLGDISVAARRFVPYGRPNRLYEIHVDNGVVKTALREYPDKLKEGWKDQFVLGSGSSVGMAFDGYWVRHRKLWRLITNEKPWIIWVDNVGILWCQHWDNESTKYQLDTGISKTKAIRGWKNVNFKDRDHGIIVGYIKTDGSVWYRSYCQQEDGSYVWEISRQVVQFIGIAANLNLFLTNDYRVGFIIEDTVGQIFWYITLRNWAGMAITSDTIHVAASSQIDITPVVYHSVTKNENIKMSATISISDLLFGRTDNTLITLKNIPILRYSKNLESYEDWGFKIHFKLNYKTITFPKINLKDSETLTELAIENIIEIVPGYEYEILIDDSILEFGFNIVAGGININIEGITNEAGYIYDVINQDFTPINLIPVEIPLPRLEVIWNE